MLHLLDRTRRIACAALVACAVLGVFAASASAAVKIEHVADQLSSEGVSAGVVVNGEEMAKVKATGLPKGISLVEETESRFKLEGTPTTAEITTVTIEAESALKATATPVKFKWTIEAAPTITGAPKEVESTVGQAIVPVTITGTHMFGLFGTLPAGLTREEVGEEEWKIEGVPTTPQPASPVTLEAQNKAGGKSNPVLISWTVRELPPTIEATPLDQTSTVGVPITPVVIKGARLASLLGELPAGLTLKKESQSEWKIEGTPTVAKAATAVTLEPKNEEGSSGTGVTFHWTVNSPAKKEVETPSKPPETPASKPPETPKPASAGRLGTVPLQKQGRELWASFLCEVSTCKVTITAAITAGKSKFKIHSAATPIAQGKKVRIPLKLNKKQRKLISAALKKRKKVSAALSASIQSSVGLQITKPLVVTVTR